MIDSEGGAFGFDCYLASPEFRVFQQPARAQQAGKLETRALFAGSQGGTLAPAGGNACAPRSVRLDLKAPAAPRVGYGPHWLDAREGFRAQAVQGPELTC